MPVETLGGTLFGVQTLNLANIPSPPQGVWYLGPIPIRAYALCIITGIIVAMAVSLRRYKARGGNPETVWDAAIVVIPAGIIGGRLYHVITDHQKLGRHGEHDHVDLVAVFDAFPEVDVRSVSFYHVVATFLQVADASCVVLHAKDPHTVDLS